MKLLIVVLLFVQYLYAEASVRYLQLGDETLTLLEEPYDLYDSKGVSVRFYKESENQDLHYLKTFVVHDKTGNCSGKSIQRGVWQSDGEVLVLYTLWTRSGSIREAPYGAKIARFRLQPDGSLKQTSAKIYIESHRKMRHDTSGMPYLFHEPKNDSEKALLQAYMRQMEKVYGGKFVVGKEAEALLHEVREEIKKEEKREQSVWKKR